MSTADVSVGLRVSVSRLCLRRLWGSLMLNQSSRQVECSKVDVLRPKTANANPWMGAMAATRIETLWQSNCSASHIYIRGDLSPVTVIHCWYLGLG